MSDNTKSHKTEQGVEILDSEKSIVLDHDYDGIKELDHPLPLWWVFVFIGTVVFGIPYYFYYVHADGPTARIEMNERLAQIYKKQADYEAKTGGFNVEKYNSFVVTEEGKKLGRKVYKRKCSACHGAKGEGIIGPNLTDKFWMHGNGKLASVYSTIAKGVTNKGMPAWKQVLDEDSMMAVTAYVLQFKGRNIQGKEAQGKEIEE